MSTTGLIGISDWAELSFFYKLSGSFANAIILSQLISALQVNSCRILSNCEILCISDKLFLNHWINSIINFAAFRLIVSRFRKFVDNSLNTLQHRAVFNKLKLSMCTCCIIIKYLMSIKRILTNDVKMKFCIFYSKKLSIFVKALRYTSHNLKLIWYLISFLWKKNCAWISFDSWRMLRMLRKKINLKILIITISRSRKNCQKILITSTSSAICFQIFSCRSIIDSIFINAMVVM